MPPIDRVDAGGTAEPDAGAPVGFADRDWTRKALSQPLVPDAEMKPLPGAMAGPPLWVSNNPELVDSGGWLMQSGRSDTSRGGKPWDLAGKFAVYLFHINRMSGGAYMHILVTNPSSTPVTVSGRGSMYTNKEKPALGPAQHQSYAVADDWLRGNLRKTFGPTTIPPGETVGVASSLMLESNMIDGRFELDASAPVAISTTVAYTASVEEARRLSQGGPARGLIVSPTPDEYGRLAGVYAGSTWRSKFPITIPTGPAYLGLALNTNGKFAKLGIRPHEQTAPGLMVLSDSGERSYGNYGAEYDLGLELVNPSDGPKTVKLSFASMMTGQLSGQDFTYDGPVAVDGKVVAVYTTPGRPRQQLGRWTLNGGERREIAVRFYVPGLSVQGQQLVLEAE
jgi:hypothetical protein